MDSEQTPRRCKARNRAGKRCGNKAMRGQEVCHRHGGKSPQALAAAERRLEREAAERRARRLVEGRLGGEVDIDPMSALMAMVRESAANVEVWRDIVADLAPRGRAGNLTGAVAEVSESGGRVVVVAPERAAAAASGDDAGAAPAGGSLWGPDHLGDNRPHIAVTLYGEERDRLVRVSKAAIDAGAAEAMVRVNQGIGALIAGLIDGLLGDPALGLDPDRRRLGREIAARRLAALEDSPDIIEQGAA